MTSLLSKTVVKQGAFTFGLMLLALLALSVFGVDIAGAQLIDPGDSPQNLTDATGGEASARTLARTMVNYFLFFLGFIATVMFIYGGILYVTAAGNDENVQKAKKVLIYSVVGILIILLSFAIVNTLLGAGLGDVSTT